MNALVTPKNACTLLVFLSVYCACAQEGGCDGPVFHPGYNNDCPDCVVGGGCGGSGTTLYSYYSCGGNTAETCNFVEVTIGYIGDCSFNWDDDFSELNYRADLQDYRFHLRWHQNSSSCDCEVTTMPDKCNYGYCAVSSGTAIKGYEYIGSSGVCTLAMALIFK
jgi:hypothetical protein